MIFLNVDEKGPSVTIDEDFCDLIDIQKISPGGLWIAEGKAS